MFRNNFRVAFRSLLKNKVYSLINIAGLSIGMAVFVLILLYIQHERTFDQFHTHKDRIYRIQQDRFNRGERTLHSVTGCYAAGPAIKASFPEVVDYVALHKVEPIIAYKGEGFKEENTCFATDKFFKYFSAPDTPWVYIRCKIFIFGSAITITICRQIFYSIS